MDKNFKLSNAQRSIIRVQRAKALCRAWDRVPQNDFAIAPCDTRKGVVYGTRLSESGFAIANPYQSQVLRLFFRTSTKREAKMLIRTLKIPAQSAETAVSAGGVGTEPPQIFTLHILYRATVAK
jgi:hypothetical protein